MNWLCTVSHKEPTRQEGGPLCEAVLRKHGLQ